MRTIDTAEIYAALKNLIEKTVCRMDADARRIISRRAESDTAPLAKWAADIIEENCAESENGNLPLCQDTGLAVIFLEVGQSVMLQGEYIEAAINRAVRDAYAPFRKSAADPLTRKNTGDNTPAVIHTKITEGDRVKISFLAKGFGSENQSRLYMLTPAEGRGGIVAAAVDAVKRAGGLPCPPVMLGIGIGGTMEKCAILAKSALLRKTGEPHPNPEIAALEKEILTAVNALNIGAQGFDGNNTCFAVHAETYPTHIAGLPVAINIQCHSVRHSEIEI